jgi:hypothetical protein
LINRDVRMANDVREGTKHVGAFKKGGKAHKLGGGPIGANPVSAQNQLMGKAAGMMKKGGRAHRDDGGPVPVPPRKGDKDYNPYPYRPAAKNPNNPPKQPAYQSGEGYVNQNPEGYKKGGKASRHPDEAEDKKLIKKMVKPSALEHKKQGGSVFSGDSKKKIPGDTGGRQARNAGGRLHREGGGRNRDPDDNTAMPMATYNFLTGWSNLDKATPDQIAAMKPQDRQMALAAQGPSRGVMPAHSAAPRKMVGSGRGVAGPTADQIRSQGSNYMSDTALNSPAPSDAQQQGMMGRAQPAMTTSYGLYGPQTANDAAINFSRQVPNQNAQPVWHYSDENSDAQQAAAQIQADAAAGRMSDRYGGRAQHAKGGRTKGKTQVNIIIGAGHHQQPQGMMGGAPMPNAPVNPQRLPPAPQGGMPPMGPQGMPPMPPQGGMPMARKSGGRTGYPIETGSGGGEARLDKIKAYGLKGRK